MKKIIIATLAATLIAAPMASAQGRPHNPHRPPPPPPHHGQHYPRGWGPHREPDRSGYYHGYRGYHDHRPGYRRGPDGFWYPAAAFALGAIIGGALNQ